MKKAFTSRKERDEEQKFSPARPAKMLSRILGSQKRPEMRKSRFMWQPKCWPNGGSVFPPSERL